MNVQHFASTILAFAITASIAMPIQDDGKRSAQEQLDFSGENESFDRPANIPDEVVQRIRSLDNSSPEDLPTKWLLASEVHLDGPSEVDLIVMGIGGLRGAHVVPFWVFRKTQKGYELVLSTGGDALSVLNTRSKGFREIASQSIGLAGREITTTTYGFDGLRYQEIKKKTESVNS